MAFGKNVLGANIYAAPSGLFYSVTLAESLAATDAITDSGALVAGTGESLSASDVIADTNTGSDNVSENTAATDGSASSIFDEPPAWRKFKITSDGEQITAIARKAPEEAKPYEIDWSEDIGSDVITGSSWSASSPDLSFSESMNTVSFTAAVISGGTADVTYAVTNTITLLSGSQLEASFRLCVVPFEFI